MITITDQFGIQSALKQLGIEAINEGTSTGANNFANGKIIESYSPADGALIAKVKTSTKEDYEKAMQKASEAFLEWRLVPAPRRGDIVRQMGDELRKFKEPLGKLVSYEMGKSLQEGYGEVQEMIDICDFAVGLSRQLYGLTMHSERPMHRMYEQYHPIGTVGIISAFNFPVAVWSWNAMIAFVCGDIAIWKPSSKVPLCGIACQNIIKTVLKRNNVPEGVSCLVTGNESGDLINNDKRIPLVSFTGSTRIGRHVSKTVAERFGKTIL
ncbi:MAG: aldehyde dehydrogenase family protein, partial [Flavobacterium sp.]|uniref:aldehyde dehydrogenase family protein n=1 Tax=Flavobacterium sp. TaxID=239 RepID=UPI00262B1235